MLIKNLNCQEFDALRSNPNCIVIDVREKQEFDSGHIPGALSFPLSTLSSASIPCAPILILYCHSGYRSKIAAEFISHQVQEGVLNGIDELMHLKPGYMQWSAEHQS